MYKIRRVPRVSCGRKFKRVTRRLSKLTENKTTSVSLSLSLIRARFLRCLEGRTVNQNRESLPKTRGARTSGKKRENERDAVEFGDGSGALSRQRGINHARCKLPELAASATAPHAPRLLFAEFIGKVGACILGAAR